MQNEIPVIIPARAGSKGILRKNIMDFCGKPLLAWSILQAKESLEVSNVYVSTDGDDIADVAMKFGAQVIRRPAEIATDTATSEAALKHAVHEIEKNESFDSAVFLQATSPLRRKNDISEAIRLYWEKGYDSLFSMTVLEDYCLWKKDNNELQSFSYDYKNRGRRQERKPLYLENGSIYVFSKEVLETYDNRLGGEIGMYPMPFHCSYEIDSIEDIPICEFFMKKILKGEL